MSTTTTLDPVNNAVTPLNTLPLKDALGVVLEKGMRVEHVRTGQRATVVRLDKRSRRAVIEFDEVEGQETPLPTMRQAHLLKVRKVAGKILFVKAAVKAGKAKA